jgi:rod shape determining protein RodA
MTAIEERPPVATAPERPEARDPRTRFRLTEVVSTLGRPRQAQYDSVLAGACAALALIGALLVWAATRDAQMRDGASANAFLYRHLFNAIITGVLMYGAARSNSRLLRVFGPVVYALSLLGLLAVFAVGSTVNGARAWIRLGGGFEVQPAEFMKLGLVVGMAVVFTQHVGERGRTGTPTRREVLAAIGLIGVPLGLIMLQPDLGSAIVLASAAFGILVAAGVRARWTIGLLLLTVVVAVVVVKVGVLHGYQLERFKVFTNPGHDPQGSGYNVLQARIAIANGGWFGRGLFHGPQTNGGYVPEQQTDFVFSVAGEEFGLIGASVIIVLFAIVCWRGFRIARGADPAGRLLAVGVVCWFAFQVFENIGMNIGLTPVTGVPLPFVSYGGSSMFAQGLAIGLLQAVRRRSVSTA